MKRMPLYRILYLLPEYAANFREKHPRNPPYLLRESHYEEGLAVEAQTPYELWQNMRQQPETEESPRALDVGDAVLKEDGKLLVCNFWGFDPAEWQSAAKTEKMPVNEP